VRGNHPGTFTVVCEVTKRCAGRRRYVLNGLLVCPFCDEIQTITTPWEQILDEVPDPRASQWWVRPA
jgi:hypothetical protein